MDGWVKQWRTWRLQCGNWEWHYYQSSKAPSWAFFPLGSHLFFRERLPVRPVLALLCTCTNGSKLSHCRIKTRPANFCKQQEQLSSVHVERKMLSWGWVVSGMYWFIGSSSGAVISIVFPLHLCTLRLGLVSKQQAGYWKEHQKLWQKSTVLVPLSKQSDPLLPRVRSNVFFTPNKAPL